MRIMGLDIGEVNIGVAVSDALGWTAQGIETIRRKGEKTDIPHILNLIKEYEVDTIVVGLPLNMDGSSGSSAAKARHMGELLKEVSSLNVIYQDERLTTMAANKMLIEADVSRSRRKQVVDKISAIFILQTYLDSQSNKSN